MRRLSYALNVLCWPMSVSAFFVAIIWMAAQSQEVLLILLETPANFVLVIAFSILLISGLSIILISLCLEILDSIPPADECSPFVALVVCYLAGLAPLAVVCAATISVGRANHISAINLGAATGLLVASACAVICFELLLGRTRSLIGKFHLFPNLISNRGIAGATVIFVLCIGLVVWAPLGAGSAVGPLGFLSIFCACIAVFLVWCGNVSRTRGIPLLFLIIAFAGLCSALGLNDNHELRILSRGKPGSAPQFSRAFVDWLSHRADLQDFSFDRPYPVFIVTAEGGGAYAGYHAALTLGRIQDSCPKFAQHVFAVSGVSGGSLGAAVFAASAKKLAQNKSGLNCLESSVLTGGFQTIADRFFSHDFLTPVLAGALFSDFAQLFLPVAIGPFDRARALEGSFEAAWRNAAGAGPNLFEQSFQDMWTAEGATPALLLNTTETEIGIRETIAPFALDMWLSPQTFSHVGSEINLRLSTAAGASARFPWMTPAATFSAYGSTFQVADGGYFENSGVETAHNLIRELQRALEATRPAEGKVSSQAVANLDDPNRLTTEIGGKLVTVSFKLLVIHNEAIPPFSSPSGELLSPLRTMLSARYERAHLAIRSALMSMCPKCDFTTLSPTDPLRLQTLALRAKPIALGWWLSSVSRDRIRESVGVGARCGFKSKGTNSIARGELTAENDCFYEFIFRDLSKN